MEHSSGYSNNRILALRSSRKLNGKAVGVFCASSLQAGGRESASLSLLMQAVHMGMIVVPLGYADERVCSNMELMGASAYGAGTVTEVDGKRRPSELELGIAEWQVRRGFISGRAICQHSCNDL